MATTTSSEELASFDRTQFESEIRALRAQVIALGGDPDENRHQVNANSDDEDSELGDLDLLPSLDVAGGGLLVDTLESAPVYSAPADGLDSDFVELSDRDVGELLSSVAPTATRTIQFVCPYCEERQSAGITGSSCNRSTVPRMQNTLGLWCVTRP